MITLEVQPSGNVEIQKDGNRILFLNPKEYRDLIDCMYPTIAPILATELKGTEAEKKPGFLKSLVASIKVPRKP